MSDEPTPPTPPISDADVSEFLRSEAPLPAGEPAPDGKKVIPIPGLTEEDLRSLEHLREKPKPANPEKAATPVERPAIPGADPNNTPENLVRQLLKQPDIVVSDMDRAIFLKAILNDDAVELSIEYPHISATMVFRQRSPEVNNLIATMVSAKYKPDGTGEIKDMSSWLYWWAQYLVATSLVSFNSKPTDIFQYDATKTWEENGKRLDAVRKSVVGPMKSRWPIVHWGLSNHETKMAMLVENIQKPDFWKPAVSG